MIKAGSVIKITDNEDRSFLGRVISVEFSGWLVEPIQGAPCTIFVPDEWKIEEEDQILNISPVLDEAISTAKNIQKLLRAALTFGEAAPTQASQAIDEAIKRIEDTMEGLDEGTIQLVVELGRIKEALA